jgi:hypothetical protein
MPRLYFLLSSVGSSDTHAVATGLLGLLLLAGVDVGTTFSSANGEFWFSF